MISLAKVILLSALVFFLLLVILFLRLIWEDSKAVEIDLREIERLDS